MLLASPTYDRNIRGLEGLSAPSCFPFRKELIPHCLSLPGCINWYKNCNKIEDETHFLLDCPNYSSIRDMFFSKIEPKIPFLRLLSHETLLSHLMNSTDYLVNIPSISFISSCFEMRDKLVTMTTPLNG